MPEIELEINGKTVRVRQGTTIASALLAVGEPCRISVTGEPRSALCGMGICYECRALVDGVVHRRTCQLECADAMVVSTQC